MKVTAIRTKMLLFVTVILLLSFSITSYLFYSQTREKEYNTMRNSNLQELGSTENMIRAYLDSYAKGMELWALDQDSQNVQKDPKNWDFLKHKFSNYQVVNPSIEGIYLATQDGKMYVQPPGDLPPDFDPRKREWYKKAIATPDHAVWTDPYISAAGGKVVISVAKAVLGPDNKQPAGVVGADVTITKLTEDLKKVKVSHGGYMFLLDQTGVAIVHPTMIGQNLKDKLLVLQQIYDSSEENGTIEYADGVDKILTFQKIDGFNWVIGFTYDKDVLFAELYAMRNKIIAVFSIALLLSLAVTYLGARQISSPIVQLTALMERVAAGDLTVHAKSKGHDEIARLALYFNKMVAEMRKLIERIVHASTDVSSFSVQLTKSAQQTTHVSEEVARTIEQVAAGTVAQAEQAERGNEQMADLAASISDLVNASEQMNRLSSAAASANQEGIAQVQLLKQRSTENREVMQSIEEVIQSLDERAKEIDVIINVITEISNQTGLLSLNAAIEAARAGEQGKGFAVVASEVQKLAKQTSLAADDIRKRVESIQLEAQRAVSEMATKGRTITRLQYQSVEDAEQAFQTIARSIDQIVSQMKLFSSEMEEITQNKDTVVMAIQEISAVSEESAAAAQEVTASTQEQIHALKDVLGAAEQLTVLAEKLQETTTQFQLDQ